MQTFQPDAMPFQFPQRHDVGEFLAEELERRTALGYPPVKIETADGRAEYEAAQRDLARRGEPLRARLRSVCGRVIAAWA